ncbi:MAG: YHS domain-containing protein [Gemmatimonadetes bacterium]|nr:YHS domain-containing protein [Gemmatimonadota bacterium]
MKMAKGELARGKTLRHVDPPMREKVTDPVCGMKLAAAKTVATVEHRGCTIYFCTQMCKRLFEEDPSRYVRP